ncbi:MAG: tRNA (N6-isopentenyl adenosine(37)-C2)-methylthiotransferase MiaB, partial [Eubacteriales bacterium]
MSYNIEDSEIARQYSIMAEVRALIGGGKRAFVQTFGCQQNEADSERLAGMLSEMGYSVISDAADADLILINTCAVREHAELKALSITGQFKHLKENNPALLIGICGCMVSQEHRRDDIKNRYPYVDFLLGTAGLYRFPEILLGVIKTGKRSFNLELPGEGETRVSGNIAEGLPVRRESG